MQAMEFETTIDATGNIRVPKEFHDAYGKRVRLVVLIDERIGSSKTRRRPGSAKGKLTILSDDDEHLMDFQDYMP